ncbi:MAG: hypothetical protein WA092_02780 [Minisyncoccales bacterium]
MEAVVVKKSLGSKEALSRAAMTVEQDSIIGVRERKLARDNLKNFHGVLRVHLYGKGNITEKLLFIMNSKAAKVLAWPGMEIGISA